MRSRNTVINVVSGWMGQALIIVVNMIARKVFLQSLGNEYLGLNSLFTNIVGLLAVAELGFGNAINYNLYKPLAEGDTETIKSLMRLYKRVYCTIGSFIIAIGLLIVPWIREIAASSEDISNVELIFVMFVFNTAVSYFFSYYSALITADQKKYIFNISHYVIHFIMYLLQIVFLLQYKNYYAYLICQMSATILENLVVTVVVFKKYPYLKEKNVNQISKENLSDIKKNVSSLILNKIGTSLVTSTDNILITKLINLSVVGIYGNYSVIVTAICNVFGQGIIAFTASIGNQLVTGTKEAFRNIFYAVQLIGSWLYGWGCICLFVLLTPFVRLWYGDYVLELPVVLILCLNSYLLGQRTVLQSYISAAGLYYNVRYRAITEGITNIIVSIVLGKQFGLLGILLGTFISGILCGWIPEAKVIINEILNIDAKQYMKTQLINVGTIFISGVMTVCICGFISQKGILGFILNLCLCILVPNIAMIILNCKNKAFLICVEKVKLVLNSMKARH